MDYQWIRFKGSVNSEYNCINWFKKIPVRYKCYNSIIINWIFLFIINKQGTSNGWTTAMGKTKAFMKIQHRNNEEDVKKSKFTTNLKKLIKITGERRFLSNIMKSQAVATMKTALAIEENAKCRPKVGCSSDTKLYIEKIVQTCEKRSLKCRLEGYVDEEEDEAYKGLKMALFKLIRLYEEELEIN